MSNVRRHKNPPITVNLDNISSSGSALFKKTEQTELEEAKAILQEPETADIALPPSTEIDFNSFRKTVLNRNLEENDGKLQEEENLQKEGDLIIDTPSVTTAPSAPAVLKPYMMADGAVPTIQLNVKYMDHYKGLPPLEYKSDGAVGFDLYAANFEPIYLNKQGSIEMIPTGISIELPPGFEAQVRSRSSLAAKFGIAVVNSPGTIDWDYRGEIFAALINLVGKRFVIERGMRIAQVVIPAPIVRATFVDVASLTETERGSGGFGSTGR